MMRPKTIFQSALKACARCRGLTLKTAHAENGIEIGDIDSNGVCFVSGIQQIARVAGEQLICDTVAGICRLYFEYEGLVFEQYSTPAEAAKIMKGAS